MNACRAGSQERVDVPEEEHGQGQQCKANADDTADESDYCRGCPTVPDLQDAEHYSSDAEKKRKPDEKEQDNAGSPKHCADNTKC